MGWAPEIDGDFRDAAGHALAGTDVKRHVGPAPVIDQDFGGDKGLRVRIGFDAGFLTIPRCVLTIDFSLCVLALPQGSSPPSPACKAGGPVRLSTFRCAGQWHRNSRAAPWPSTQPIARDGYATCLA